MIHRHTRDRPLRHERRNARRMRPGRFGVADSWPSPVGVVKPEPTAVALAAKSGSGDVMTYEFSRALHDHARPRNRAG